MENCYKTAKFITSIVDLKDSPLPHLEEILFVGKSNVGKSSLINALANQKALAFTSKTPGHTRLLNYFMIDNSFYFVDSPGYGFSAKKDIDYEFYGKIFDSYFTDNANLKLIVFLLDSRHLPTQDDQDFYIYLKHFSYPYIIAMTKCDKLNQSEKAKIYKNLDLGLNETISKDQVVLTSSKNKDSLGFLKQRIDSALRR